MNESLKKVSADFKANLENAIASGAFKTLVEQTKVAEDSGTFEVIISTADIDRSGESIDQNGWNLDHYKANPVVLWGHDYYALPIGICESIEMKDGKLIAKGRFAPMEANPFAQQVRRLYDAKIVRATSVGFIVSEMEGNNITKAELLEFSFVPVPANPHALSLSQAKSLGLDVAMLAMKGLSEMMVKEEVAQDPEPETVAEPVVEEVVEPEAPLAEPETEQKGAIAEEIVDQDAWEEKWKRLDKFCEIVDATFSIYLDEKTAVDTFETLMAEAGDLIKALGGSAEAGAKIAEVVAAKTGESDPIARAKAYTNRKAADDLIQAVGASLAKMQATVDTAMSDGAIEILDIVGGSSEDPEEKGGVAEDGGAITAEETLEGVMPKMVDSAKETLKEMDSFQVKRALLRAIATATTDALTEINKRDRKTVRRR